jgi:DNA adenine methylase
LGVDSASSQRTLQCVRVSTRLSEPPAPTLRPFLKWAGGKRQLLPALRRFYPAEFGRYFEPFVGSGAVFFDLTAGGRLDGRRAFLTDSNTDLVGCYRAVRDWPGEILGQLERLARGHASNPTEHFYRTRERFNRQRMRLADRADGYTPALAAMLMYLNRTAFNGLFRLNAAGGFNVPAGRYVNPRIVDHALVEAVSAALRRKSVSIELAPFEHALERAEPGDFLYFDPPYAPLSATARFTSYTQRPFALADHARLRDAAVELASRGCHVMVSNSSAGEIATLYEDPHVARAGLRVHRLPARRAINSRASARGPIVEFLLTNLPARTEAAPI